MIYVPTFSVDGLFLLLFISRMFDADDVKPYGNLEKYKYWISDGTETIADVPPPPSRQPKHRVSRGRSKIAAVPHAAATNKRQRKEAKSLISSIRPQQNERLQSKRRGQTRNIHDGHDMPSQLKTVQKVKGNPNRPSVVLTSKLKRSSRFSSRDLCPSIAQQ